MSFQRRCVYLPAVDSPASAKFLRVRRAAANVRHSTKSNDTHSQSSEFPLLQNSVARGGIRRAAKLRRPTNTLACISRNCGDGHFYPKLFICLSKGFRMIARPQA